MTGTGTRADATGLGAALRAAAGSAAVFEVSPPARIAGAEIDWQVEPGDARALAATLGVLDAAGVPALVRGGGSRLESGRPSPEARVLLSTRSLAGVLCFEPEEGVIEIAAGTKLLDVVDHLKDTIWELPLDAPGEDATVGGVLAAAATGPRALAFGPVRHQVLGLQVALADGTLARCGGRVVKNVTGYDLAKLHVGGEGAFGVIASAWLRLRPRPEATRTLAVPFDDRRAAVAAAVAAARLPSARMATLLSGDLAARASGLVDRGASWVLAVELAGSAAICARDGARLLETPRSTDRPFSVDSVGAVTSHEEGPALHARISLLATEIGLAIELLHAAGLALAAQPGSGLLEASLQTARSEEIERAVGALHAVAAGVSGRIVATLRSPEGDARPLCLGVDAAETELLRALKHRFDPRGVLNPGRLAEGV